MTEIGADVHIGDHLKQSCQGMISYRWIEECCKQGELLDLESHKIRRSRTTGIHRTGRRNEFSAEDDRILLDHIKKSVARGESAKGNRIYDSLAQAVRSFCMSLIIASPSYFSIMAE